ncbi:LysR family transcriptional regulator [Herbaspirillum seropedicae]|uniref:LysR family transcription regulator protein n=1 Tax=Herbaspirillum seropedicae (strain SmR1) TaxID=757424 RepID=D8IRC3_HERSS|nr:LysR family transcriptional regulator [Herbaspirillum seropedicae]ADJ65249.1 LysR family transcription regulator protein [Herbaspirillum seropedicae SmR1]AKN67098.1 LysR family transcriptional regulator [Herbaspirillum seropedicae]MDR6395526.1 DNA-binding transcriptional LysR family regulator [Herbaspirillum seropedicae]NQE30301.1 LysR family transcriptional regulator [Herbaspirillum seropedicae]UMU23104.1 LysR family transcriptional regulator [Herbaspirillum seropedicae]
MIRLEDLAIFVCAADNGSLSAAARQHDVTPAVASAAMKRLEGELGARLLARSTRSLRLTPDGERYLQHARNVLAEVNAGRDAVAHGRRVIGGNLSLSAPSDFGRNLIGQWLDEFQAQHPAVSLQVHVSDRVADMYRQPVDVAIRYSAPDDSSLVALPLAPDNRRVLCASPDYLARHGRPRSPADLRQHNCLRYVLSDTLHSQWNFFKDDEPVQVQVSGDRTCDDGELVRRWAVNGRGIAYKSRLDVLADLRNGRLEALLEDYEGEPSPLHLVCTHRMCVSPTVRALRELLGERIARYLKDR